MSSRTRRRGLPGAAGVVRRTAPSRTAGSAPASRSSACWQSGHAPTWVSRSPESAGDSSRSSRRRSAGGQEEGTGMRNPSEAGSVGSHPANLLGETGEHAALGDVDGTDGQPQGGGDSGGAFALDGGPPERLPGRRGEGGPDGVGGQV